MEVLTDKQVVKPEAWSSPRGENLDTKWSFTNFNFGSSRHRNEAQSIKYKNNLVAFPTFPNLFVKFQRNRPTNVEDLHQIKIWPYTHCVNESRQLFEIELSISAQWAYRKLIV